MFTGRELIMSVSLAGSTGLLLLTLVMMEDSSSGTFLSTSDLM